MDEAQTSVKRRRSTCGKRVSITCPMCGLTREVLAASARENADGRCRICSKRAWHGLEIDAGAPSMRGTRLYRIWTHMRVRCGVLRGTDAAHRRRYIDRGISVCDEWAKSFETFRRWAEANGYANGLLLDREDNDRGYSPANCRWVDEKASSRNRHTAKLTAEAVRNIKIALRAGGQTQKEIARSFGVSHGMISAIHIGRTWADVSID